ncbi:MAG: Uma2 family endonuclease [Bryobacteraceae bacterium]
MAVGTSYDYHTELIDGVEVEKPLPKNLHAFIQTYLIAFLTQTLPKNYRVASELNVICGKDRLVPDVTVIERMARYEDGDLADSPLLAVEIMSPGQTFASLLDKCKRLLNTGTQTCWMIWPERREAWKLTNADALQEAVTTLGADLPHYKIRMPLTDLWAELD